GLLLRVLVQHAGRPWQRNVRAERLHGRRANVPNSHRLLRRPELCARGCRIRLPGSPELRAPVRPMNRELAATARAGSPRLAGRSPHRPPGAALRRPGTTRGPFWQVTGDEPGAVLLDAQIGQVTIAVAHPTCPPGNGFKAGADRFASDQAGGTRDRD